MEEAMGGGLRKLSCVWDEGIFLGVKGTIGEFILGDGKGINRTRTVHRRQLVAGVPWRKSEDDPKVDGEMMDFRGPSGGKGKA